MAYFKIDECPSAPNRYMIRPNFDTLPLYSTNGSYSVIMARVMGITYANYLRLCRDEYGAELVGKGFLYPVPYFNELNNAKELVKELEKRIYTIKKELRK